MNPEAWVALATVFVLGAMSPGPSRAVVLRNTMVGGRRQGVMTGIGHGIGFGIYWVPMLAIRRRIKKCLIFDVI